MSAVTFAASPAADVDLSLAAAPPVRLARFMDSPAASDVVYLTWPGLYGVHWSPLPDGPTSAVPLSAAPAPRPALSERNVRAAYDVVFRDAGVDFSGGVVPDDYDAAVDSAATVLGAAHADVDPGVLIDGDDPAALDVRGDALVGPVMSFLTLAFLRDPALAEVIEAALAAVPAPCPHRRVDVYWSRRSCADCGASL